MGNYDGAELGDLVDLYLLDLLTMGPYIKYVGEEAGGFLWVSWNILGIYWWAMKHYFFKLGGGGGVGAQNIQTRHQGDLRKTKHVK